MNVWLIISIAVLVIAAGTLLFALPQIRRYFKIKNM